jgi:hypothetical protein
VHSIFAIIDAVSVTGCNDDASSGFTTANYFPLNSGWETDKWTLFTDENEYEINGVSTTAMVDTGTEEAYFWSNGYPAFVCTGFGLKKQSLDITLKQFRLLMGLARSEIPYKQLLPLAVIQW